MDKDQLEHIRMGMNIDGPVEQSGPAGNILNVDKLRVTGGRRLAVQGVAGNSLIRTGW